MLSWQVELGLRSTPICQAEGLPQGKRGSGVLQASRDSAVAKACPPGPPPVPIPWHSLMAGVRPSVHSPRPDPPFSAGYAYFLRGRLYWKFDPVKVKVLEGFPRRVGPDFFGCAEPANSFH